MKAEPSQLIPRKLTANLELLLVIHLHCRYMMHWFIILIFLLVCGHSVLGTTCLHYSGGENTFRDPDDSPCLKVRGNLSARK